MLSTYSKLYPNLQFNQLKLGGRHQLPNQAQPKNDKEPEPKPEQSEPPKEKTTKPKAKKVKPPKPEKTVDELVAEKVAEQMKLLNQPQQQQQQQQQAPVIIEQTKVVKVKDADMGTDRPEHHPEKGKKGFKTTRTIEQKKEAYLSRLSKKSLNKANKEMEDVDKVLEEANGDKTQIENLKKDMKKKMTLINRAILFADNSERVNLGSPKKEEPELDTSDSE